MKSTKVILPSASTGALATGSVALLALNLSTDAHGAIISDSAFTLNGVTAFNPIITSNNSDTLGAFNGNAVWYMTGSFGSSSSGSGGSSFVGACFSWSSGSGELLNSGNGIKLVNAGYSIGATDKSQSFSDYQTWNNLDGQNGYIGVEFQMDDGTHYGWMEAAVSGGSLTLSGWGYEDVANTAIAAGVEAIPEPAALSLLAGGAVGLMALRRRFSV